MHIKHLRHGTGSGKGAAEYLTREADSHGQVRDEVRVLDGDPDQVAAVADSLDFKHRYTSGVIAWGPEERPTEAQLQEVLNDYKKAAFAGLDPDQYAFSAVLHREGEAVHIHTFTARCELTTGKSLNIAPPGHQKIFDAVRDYHNHKNGWARPDDPELQRLNQPKHQAYITAAELRQGLQVEPDPRQLVTDYLVQRVDAGEIGNRDNILSALTEVGLETPRAGKNYITVQDPESGAKWRLKGAIYNADFQRGELERQATQELGDRPAPNRAVDERSAERAYSVFESECERRAEYNRGRYPGAEQSYQRANDRAVQQSATLEKTADKAVSHDVFGPDRNLADYLRSQLGPGAILAEQSRHTENGDQRGRNDFGQAGQGRRENPAESLHRQPGPAASLREDRQGRGRVREQGRIVDDTGGLLNDRDGANIAEKIDRADRTHSAADRANTAVSRAADAIGRACKPSGNVVRGVQRMTQNSNDELERFKVDINLSEFLADRGYQLDKAASCTGYAVMRKNDEKLVVTKAPDQHYIYTDAHNPDDSGSIIDFVQNRTGENLGSVRKRLRPWIGEHKHTQKTLWQSRISISDRDYGKVVASWEKANTVQNFDYLRARGISSQTVRNYGENIRQSEKGTLLFKHTGMNGTSGYEYKSSDLYGFSTGGSKGLFIARRSNPQDITRLVVTETALDALSYAQLDGCRKDTAYVSTGGNPSNEQLAYMAGLTNGKTLENLKTVTMAHDKDQGGEQQAMKIGAHLHATGAGVRIERETPTRGKDWNEQLQQQKERNRDRGMSL